MRSDPIDLEARYVELFDRGRSTSLHLFEHVHGDSRDRGPAMIDLIKPTRPPACYFDGKELPDHLCVVLEFASTQPPAQAKEFLGELAHILQAIFSALRQRDSAYASLVAAVLELAGHKVEAVPVTPDESLDASWAEPDVFGGCSTRGQAAPGAPQPIQIVRRHRRHPRSTLMKALDLFLFGYYPYICLVVFLLGQPDPLRPRAVHVEERFLAAAARRQLRWGSNLFHVGVLFLLFGHTVGMLTPHFVYEPFMGAGTKQLMAMVTGGIAGLLAFIGVSILLHRRLTDPRIRANSRSGHPACWCCCGCSWPWAWPPSRCRRSTWTAA